MNFDHEELMLMVLYNTGTRLGLVQELRCPQKSSCITRVEPDSISPMTSVESPAWKI